MRFSNSLSTPVLLTAWMAVVFFSAAPTVQAAEKSLIPDIQPTLSGAEKARIPSDEELADAEKALRMLKKNHGEKDESVIDALIQIAQIHELRNNASQADLFYTRALFLGYDVLGRQHPKLSKVKANLANLYALTGRMDEADMLFVDAIESLKATEGAKSILLVDPLTKLGEVRKAAAQYDAALAVFKEAHAILEAKNSKDPKDLDAMSAILYHMADVYLVYNDYDHVHSTYLQIIKLILSYPNPDDEQLGAIYNNLGSMHATRGNYAVAEHFYQKTLEILVQHRGPDDPEVKTVLENLDNLYLVLDERKNSPAEKHSPTQ